ncbi:TonB-dependent receptor domain-containing protein [Sphingomonas sp. LHG3443-2]|uniref:TonB-dependent receptor domain-containing protein n=1 Tax=Sphingomonas sp. LHG3443-2 TaxID=2804639 RepID=UPI003CEA0468
MSRLASLLLVTTVLCPAAALAQAGGAAAPVVTPPTGPAGEATAPEQPASTDEVAPTEEPVIEVSAPGVDAPGDIIVRGRRNILRSAPEVVSVLSSEDIARTGDGDIAGALQRVPGLSVVGNGFVYVRGLGDRYSLALLNGLALPSPEPLRRVVPLDIFPTSVIGSAVVQKSYSVNYPGEFGGGVINLTTTAAAREPFLTIGASISGDTETTGKLGYTYYGSSTDWLGFDNGDRAIDGAFGHAFRSNKVIGEGSNFTRAEVQAITADLTNSRTSVLQRNMDIPANLGVDLTGGTTFNVGGTELGLIASAGYSNSWRTRDATQQTQGGDLIGTDFQAVRTDNRVIANGLLGLTAKIGGHNLRFTNLLIRDTLKIGRLAAGYDVQIGDPIPGGPAQQINQRTAWFERQLLNSQLVGEFKFRDLDLDLRGGYANSQRNAPYERSFNYVYNSQIGDYVNNLTTNPQSAGITFSELDEDVWNLGGDVSYRLPGERNITLSAGGAYLDTTRNSTRRDFAFRPANALPGGVTEQRPDYLLSDFNVYTYNILLVETSGLAGTARYQGDLRVAAGYAQATGDIVEGLRLQGGVRFEDGKQSVTLVDLFNQGGLAQIPAIEKSYWLPAATLTWTIRPDMQLRLHGSKTLARPQFRELAPQVYFDTESDRQFFGNPFLTDSTLTNAEARYEWYFATQQRVSVAGFFKRINKPIEAIANFTGGAALITTFGNAPRAKLYGVEVEAQKFVPLGALGMDQHRLVLIGNYTFSKSEIEVSDGDTTILNDLRGPRPAREVFFDGDPLTGQSKHIANGQIGIENTAQLQQLTLLFNYASKRVTSRGPASAGVRQADIFERPGLTVDLVARQGIRLGGKEIEVKFEARNLTEQDYEETQDVRGTRIFVNRYDVGRSFSLGASVKF